MAGFGVFAIDCLNHDFNLINLILLMVILLSFNQVNKLNKYGIVVQIVLNKITNVRYQKIKIKTISEK